MEMTWYFALSESTIDREEHDWRGLMRVAVKSAYSKTRLRPTLIYDGQPSKFTAELQNMGVKIIHHRVSFYDELAEYAVASGQQWWVTVASGAFLRTEIPLLHPNDDPVLYTDCDVMFMQDVTNLNCSDLPFAIVPEYVDGVVGDYIDINSGVMVMNIASLRRTFVDFRTYIRNNLDKCVLFDQSAYRQFYAGQWGKLEPELNWRPYWGFNNAARVVHWHGPKPPFVRRLLQGTGVPEGYDLWRVLYDKDPESYGRYLSIWDEYSQRPLQVDRSTAE